MAQFGSGRRTNVLLDGRIGRTLLEMTVGSNRHEMGQLSTVWRTESVRKPLRSRPTSTRGTALRPQHGLCAWYLPLNVSTVGMANTVDFPCNVVSGEAE